MVQKYALYYTLQDEIGGKFELGSKLVDVFKMYVNPMMFSKEQEILHGETENSETHTNAFFEDISKSGRETGKMPLTKEMKQAIDRMAKHRREQEKDTDFGKMRFDDNSPIVVG